MISAQEMREATQSNKSQAVAKQIEDIEKLLTVFKSGSGNKLTYSKQLLEGTKAELKKAGYAVVDCNDPRDSGYCWSIEW